ELTSAASVIKRPHLSAVCLLKNCAINFVYRVAALPAAEKRDYAELFRRRQQLVEDFFITQLAANRRELLSTPTTPPTGNPHHYCLSTASTSALPLSLQRCVVQRGANIRDLPPTWQHLCCDERMTTHLDCPQTQYPPTFAGKYRGKVTPDIPESGTRIFGSWLTARDDPAT
ncbi:hypothetical protein, partial [Ralstonia pseudosolanacearum]|uniref:hypothetical protein n=1 Tax=Ralstonia pseudosolanacearum TaxID=1310165 RepID=UPI001FF96875